jgi:eukaryotic-like serine/threonine-protein kinase
MVTMPSHDWETIKQVFSAALNVPAAAREAYLVRACGGRADLRHAVDDLLRAHQDASLGFLEPGSIIVRATWVFAPGSTVAGRFRIVKPIARGAMGEVYQVYDERLRLHVALKAIRPELLSDAGTVERFRREVLVTRDIAHEGLCRVFDLVEHQMPAGSGYPDGTVVPCLTMQLLDGINLEDWLAAHRPLSMTEAMPLVQQIADALQVLHRHGVVHRDLKPSNVMLIPSDAGQRAVLTDFGLAKPLQEGLFETQPGAHGGAPYFMAPELFEGERPSPASDIYAFGLLIDEMITSRRAFPADSLHGLLLQKLHDDPEPPSRRGAAAGPAWDRVVLRCLSRARADRYGSAAECSSRCPPTIRRRHRGRGLPGRPGRPPVRAPGRPPVYAAVIIAVVAGAATLSGPQATSPRSVVVTPFANLSSDPEVEYLARGMAGNWRGG